CRAAEGRQLSLGLPFPKLRTAMNPSHQVTSQRRV
ncbi:mCG140813, partial [Mus musculus]